MLQRNRIYISTVDAQAGALAARYDLGVEIAEYCTAWNMDEKYSETHNAVLAQLTGCPNRILHAPFNELFPCAIDPKARSLATERYRQSIALARQYGAKKVVIHGGYNPWLYYPVWYVEQSVVFWKDFLREDPGVELVLENVLEEEPKLLLEILQGVNDPRLRMCLDVGHANAYSKVSAMEWLERCAPWISHFHIHNNDGSWDTHQALDQGTVPMAQLLRRAAQLCPEATFTLELTDAEPSVKWLLEL